MPFDFRRLAKPINVCSHTGRDAVWLYGLANRWLVADMCVNHNHGLRVTRGARHRSPVATVFCQLRGFQSQVPP